jgi:hypothetical protein
MSVSSATVKKREKFCRITREQIDVTVEYLSRIIHIDAGEDIGEVRLDIPEIFTHLEGRGMLYTRYCRLTRHSTGSWCNVMLVGYMEHDRDNFAHQRLITQDELAQINPLFDPTNESKLDAVSECLSEPRVMVNYDDPPIVEIRYTSPVGEFMIPLELTRAKKETHASRCNIL